MIDEHRQDLAAEYALDALDPESTRAFEAMLANDAELKALADDLRETAAALAHDAPPQLPPPELRERVLSRIRAEAQAVTPAATAPAIPTAPVPPSSPTPAPGSPSRNLLPWALAAGFAITTASLWMERNQLRQDRDALVQEARALRDRDNFAKVKIAMLSAQVDAYAKASAVIVWDPEKQRGVLKLANVPQPESGKDYQLWVIDPKYPQPVSGGLVPVNAEGMARVTFEPPLTSRSAGPTSLPSASNPRAVSRRPPARSFCLGAIERTLPRLARDERRSAACVFFGMRTIWSLFRLLSAFVLCAAAALVLVQAPTIPLFQVALVVTEFGHWLFVIPLVLAFLPAPRTLVNHLATALALVATVLLVSSVIRAQAVARRLPQELSRAIPGTESGATPFSWKKLWFAPRIEPVAVEKCVYAQHDGDALQMLLYRQSEGHPAACVVVIHGGGWSTGSAKEGATLNHYLARHGYAVAAIEYRLAPRWPWPAQRDDVLEAIDYLQAHAVALGIDPQRFVLLGRSAGGQIAEAVAYGAHRPAIRGCVAFYAPADMHYAFEFARADDILNSPQLLRQFLGGTPTEARANYDSASSILLAQRDSPPTLLIHGRRDELVWFRQSERLAARLESIGAPHCFVQLPWATHAFDYNFNGPGGQISTYAVETFLAAVTK